MSYRILWAVVAFLFAIILPSCTTVYGSWLHLATVISSEASSLTPITHLYTVSPNLIALQIRVGEITRGQQMPYQPLPQDRINEKGWIQRKGQFIGYLVDADRSIMRTLDQFQGVDLADEWLETPSNYQIISPKDPTYDQAKSPITIRHKVKPLGIAEINPYQFKSPENHTIYLQLPYPLKQGYPYQLKFQGNVLQNTAFIYDPAKIRSEAVHVSQLGFHPHDPAKVAFLSTWMGIDAGVNYKETKKFWLIDSATGQKVYQGDIQLSKVQYENEDKRKRNYNGTDVYLMDFSDFQQMGKYQVLVEGVGTSFPFEIGQKTWEKAFYTSVRGFYHQRSGIALQKPYTDYERPRTFHPDDGVKVYQSTIPLMDTNMGLNLANVSAFEGLIATRTNVTVPEAWGGWFDAGDWDRRIQHLNASRLLLELVASDPDYFKKLNLNLPESQNSIPDEVDEALWGLAVFKRLQTPEGGIRGGIESAGHPKKFAASWQESQTVMVYGPGIWSSYIYAGVAARAADVLRSYEPKLAKEYAKSAEKAMKWAEKEYAAYTGRLSVEIDNERNLAAAELYRLTGAKQWHQIFLDTTIFTKPGVKLFQSPKTRQENAAFVYVQTRQPSVDSVIQDNARQAILREANTQIAWLEQTGFKWYKHPNAPLGWGNSLGKPEAITLIRAHQLTGDAVYLRAIILATQFSAGANPDNLVYTTGLGQRSPQEPLMADVQAMGINPPPGITVYGPLDNPHQWKRVFNLFAESVSPWPSLWPTTEGYFDVSRYVPATEFTIYQTLAPTAYAWGYLAAVNRH